MLKIKYVHIGMLIVFLVSGYVFYDTFLYQVWQSDSSFYPASDIPFHARSVADFSTDHFRSFYTIWYPLVFLISGFSTDYDHIAYVMIAMLASLIVLKYTISYWILSDKSEDKKLAAFFSLFLIFVMPIIHYSTSSDGLSKVSHIYLGNVSPNQWHNSTLIFAMPANIIWFYYSVKNIHSEKLSSFFMMGALCLLSIICKPNYALAFLPVLCTAILVFDFCLKRYFRGLAKVFIIATPSVFVLGWQWYLTFSNHHLSNHPITTKIAPLLVWSHYSSNIPLALLLSIAFPLLVLIFYFRKIDSYLILSWCTFLVALSTMILFVELPNWQAANFLWGAIAANFILFLFSVRCLLMQPDDGLYKIARAVFVLHLLSGIYFLVNFFTQQTSLLF